MLRITLFRRTSTFVRLFNSNRNVAVEAGDLLRDIMGSKRPATSQSLKVGEVRNRSITMDKSKRHTYRGVKQGSVKGKPGMNRKKRIVINWQSGTERAQEAANDTIQRVFRLNSKGTINIFDNTTKQIEPSNIKSYAKGLDLDTHGLSIVDVETVSPELRVPLVKIVDSKTALKRYSDEIARRKEEELIEKGVIRKRNTDTSSRTDASLKHVKLTWKVQEDDLLNQKAREIETQLTRGNKLNIYIDDGSRGTPKNWLDSFENVSASAETEAEGEVKPVTVRIPKKELRRRESIVEQIKTLVEELSIVPVIEGGVESKMIIRLSPKATTAKKVDTQSLKEERKRQRQEKLAMRVQKKKERLSTE